MASIDSVWGRSLVGPAALWLSRELVREGDDDAALLSRWAAAGVLRDLARWRVRRAVYEPAAACFSPRDADPLPGLAADGTVYTRTVWGTCTCETLPRERRMGLFPWSRWLTSGLYWCDGRRPLAAVERLARAETGTPSDTGLAEPFDRCVEAGRMRRPT
jgi:hypothetical protein